MTGAHWHLVLNHIPVIGTFFVLLFLVIGLLRKRDFVKKISLWILLLLALITLPVYFTGESAHEELEDMPLVSMNTIHEHEEAAELAFAGELIIGGLVILYFLFNIFKSKLVKPIFIIILILTFATAGLMAWTANLGGKIRRPELRGETVSPSYEKYYDIEKEAEPEKPQEP